jgi:hypothetical protein
VPYGPPLTREEIDIQYHALELLYNHTDGVRWKFQDEWLNFNSSYCKWYGVICDSGGGVYALQLSKNYMQGNLRRKNKLIRGIFFTAVVNIIFICLLGSLPSSIADLKSLVHLNVNNNMFTGE